MRQPTWAVLVFVLQHQNFLGFYASHLFNIRLRHSFLRSENISWQASSYRKGTSHGDNRDEFGSTLREIQIICKGAMESESLNQENAKSYLE